MTDMPLLTDEHRIFRDQLRRFVENEVRPHGDTWEADGQIPREVLRRMGELGFLGIRYPETYGGAEMDTVATVIFAEELGRSGYGGFAITALVHTDMASPHLANAGTPDQLARYMPDIIAGRKITAVAVTEPDAGSDVSGIKTRAQLDGNHWVLNGRKLYITNGVLGDLYFVAARTDMAQKSSRGTTIFIVEKGTPGFTVARPLDKSGWRSSDTAELIFEDVRIPADQVLGQIDGGFYAIMQNFQNERIVLGAQAMGEALRALEITLDYVKDRKAFGATLWDKQAIRQRLSQRWAEVAAARALIYQTALAMDAGNDCVREVSAIKALCGDLVNKVMYDCQQFHGGFGYMSGTEIERMVRDARVQAIGGGATEVMLEEIAKRL
ncbi:acyl-CoA dehydrogenase [Roseovarius litoreus]|jgi:acyl-CoA dehydrogenase|uniref:Acyl-CoA dehydrogenase n=1 Tax=Roseovarius litoreus TaxID=1155722 RepID=A0A1M7EFT5_9RHOB|nr:acyl-CoA dehydrogenase family protein [Roseovarius litoreus]SHL90496.1 acyl-CoA dehydrogenase [Roseovarius litoreus]